MQVFGNIASPIQRKTTKAGKAYAEFRLAESQRSRPGSSSDEPTWYTVRVMHDNVPEFVKGDFVRVTGKLKTDFYLGRDGNPSGTLLIIAFEAHKVAKSAQGNDEAKDVVSEVAPAKATVKVPEPARVTASIDPVEPMQTSSWADW